MSQISNIRIVFESFVEVTGGNAAGFVSDESGCADDVDGFLQGLAARLVQYAGKDYIRPQTFLGIGATHVFSETFWGRFRFRFIAGWNARFKHLDKSHLPHRDYKSRIVNSVLILMSRFPCFRRRIDKNIKKLLLLPLKNVR